MLMNGVSNRKLHCCLIVLILFILIFLSIPLLLIYIANNRYEERENLRAQYNLSTVSGAYQMLQTTATATAATTNSINSSKLPNIHSSLAVPSIAPTLISTITTVTPLNTFKQDLVGPSINCSLFGSKWDSGLVDETFQCPLGTFPCHVCPDICIEQWRNCDGVADCPYGTDERESYCHDSNGAMGVIFQNIVNNAARKKQSSNSSNLASNLSKPDSCTFEQFVLEQCPCIYTDPRVIICEGLGLSSVPNTFLSSVFKIRMSNNTISNIDHVLWPRSLSSLVLQHNRITHIGRSAFQMAPNLSLLYLSHNEISSIDSEAFAGLTSLTTLQIEANKLKTFDSRMLLHTPAITKIYMAENMIDLPDGTRFGVAQNLRELLLDHNRISIIRSHWFSNMTSLIWLSLTYNDISFIEDGSFNWNYELEELNLSFNKIKIINSAIFAQSLNIQRLYLGGNPLRTLPIDAFREIVHLKSLNLTDIDFDYINKGTFSYLSQLEFIYFAKFRYCHYATHVRVCRPLTDGLSSVQELLAFPILKYAVWIVASVCSLGNVFVLIWRSISPHEDQTLSLFIKNLSIADLMMGIYLGAIGWQDWKFQHNFRLYAIEWMSSWTCTSIGFLAILSSELSVFILTIITVERYMSIVSIKRFEEIDQRRRARTYVALAWFFSTLIAIYPLVEWMRRSSDVYATNGLCLPLNIDNPFSPGWQYSAFIYLGINFSAVMIIIVLYMHMYSMIMDSRQTCRPFFKEEKREDAILAIRFFFIVVTDCLCWIPIVVIKVIALANVSISSSIYGWLVVFIIPINSALNPIVYTLAAPTSLRSAVCRLFEHICCKVDILASSGSHYSSQSFTGSGNLESQDLARRRNNTGSNSTTYENIETSMASQQRSSAETTFIQQPIKANNLVSLISFPAKLFSSNSIQTKSEGVENGTFYNGNVDGAPSYHEYRMTAVDCSTANTDSSGELYDYLSIYEHNGGKSGDANTPNDRLIEQVAGWRRRSFRRRKQHKGKLLVAYDSLDRWTRPNKSDIDEHHTRKSSERRCFGQERLRASGSNNSNDSYNTIQLVSHNGKSTSHIGRNQSRVEMVRNVRNHEETSDDPLLNRVKSTEYTDDVTLPTVRRESSILISHPRREPIGKQARVSFSSKDSGASLLEYEPC